MTIKYAYTLAYSNTPNLGDREIIDAFTNATQAMKAAQKAVDEGKWFVVVEIKDGRFLNSPDPL